MGTMPSSAPLQLSADGTTGRDGAPGTGWMDAAGRSDDGRRGGDGRPGERGSDAGTLEVTLSTADRSLRLAGTSSTGGPAQCAFVLGSGGQVLLSAHGGDGGRGGDAGRGQDGGVGHDGSDATRYSSGSDGGPGGRGGDAGEPADGGDAGAGGLVRIHLAEDDSDLLAACRWDVDAGQPGPGGDGARGGAGGAGGNGGSSYSWTESYSDTESYRDSDGHTRTRSVTRYRHHSNPGGSDGRDGDGGQSSRRQAQAGRAASTGRLALLVRQPDGTLTTYDSAWELELVEVVLEPLDERLFPGDRFEPGQVLRVVSLRVANRGGMPTPRGRDLEVWLDNDHGVECLAPVILQRGLAPGATIELRDTAGRLRLADDRRVGEDPFDGDLDLSFRVVVPRLRQPVPTRLVHRVALASPIVLEKPQVYTALGLGERTAWTWRVVNRSLLPFGCDAPRPAGLPPRLLVTTATSPAGDAPPDGLSVGRGEAPAAWDRLVDPIPLLAPGDHVDIAYHLSWNKGSRSFTGRDLAVGLEVGHRDSGNPQPCQVRPDRIKVAAAYRKTPEAAVLLIANHGTAAPEVEAWVAFLADLGLEADVLDLSYEGAVDLDMRFSPTQSLREEWRGRTVIALNNLFDSPNGRQSCADYLYDRQVVNAIRDDDISWFVPGDGRPLFTRETLLAMSRGSRLCEQRTMDARQVPTAAIADDSDMAITVTQVRRFGMRPRDAILAELAEAWSRRLAVLHPDRRWLLVHRADPRKEEGGWWKARWYLGILEVREYPMLGNAGMATLPCAGDQLHDSARIRSPENRAATIFALPFTEKLRLFVSLIIAGYNFDLVPERRALAEAYADAIVADLALEQEAVRRSAGTWAAWSLSGMVVEHRRIWCERWRLLCTTSIIAALPAGSERGRILARLIGRMRALVRGFAPWWQCLLLGSRQYEITRQCRRLLDGLEQAAFGRGRPLFTMPDEPWSDERRNLGEARRRSAAEAARIRKGQPVSGATADRFLASACPEIPVTACSLRRMPDQMRKGVVDGATRDAACRDQDAEDAKTAARTAEHRAARQRLTVKTAGADTPPPAG